MVFIEFKSQICAKATGVQIVMGAAKVSEALRLVIDGWVKFEDLIFRVRNLRR